MRFATWNILGDKLNRAERLAIIAERIREYDFVAIQEVVLDEGQALNTANVLGHLTSMKVASCISGEIPNLVSGEIQGTAILSRYEIFESNISIFAPIKRTGDKFQEYRQYAACILRAPNGRLVLVCSVHFPWGAHNEARRLEHALSIDIQISKILQKLPAGTIAVLVGDFNCTPESETMRFLKGNAVYKQQSTFWVDIWDDKGKESGYTFDPRIENSSLKETAFRSGIKDPIMMPPRRLDFILLKGWVYGRPGSPLLASIIGNSPSENGLFGSDHFGLEAEIWNPD